MLRAVHAQLRRLAPVPAHAPASAGWVPRPNSTPSRDGVPLEASSRSELGRRLHFDFSSVRIHADADAARAARSLRARAFTVGSDIYLAAGQIALGTAPGRWLLAHELVHVAQQGNPLSSDGEVEVEARRAATLVTLGREARPVRGRAPDSVHRFGEPENVPDLTYVSTQGPPDFLAEATSYHKVWGLHPIQIASMEAVVNDLARRAGIIGRVRIVLHAADVGVLSSIFAGEPSLLLPRERLTAWATSDVAGLVHDIGQTIQIGAGTIRSLTSSVRRANAALLKPFGLDHAGTPNGPLHDLFEGSARRFIVQASRTRDNRRRIDAVLAALDAVLANGQAAVAAQGGIPAPEVAGLEAAVTAACGEIGLHMDEQLDPDAATRAVAGGFRQRLDRARQRFQPDSWIDIRGCQAGTDLDYLRAVSTFFGAVGMQPHVSGPDWFQLFNTLGIHEILDQADLDGLAGDADVRAALDRWAPLTGVRAQVAAWRSYYASEVARHRQLAAPSTPPGRLGLRPGLQLQIPRRIPPLRGGLTTPPSEAATSDILMGWPMLLQEPSLSARSRAGPSLLQPPALRDPALDLAERALQRLLRDDAEVRYYFAADLVLPVAVGGDSHDTRLYVFMPRSRQAISNWLVSQWRTHAPGLAALQAGSWRGDQRWVQALVESEDAHAEMVFSPDPRYMDHIKKI